MSTQDRDSSTPRVSDDDRSLLAAAACFGDEADVLQYAHLHRLSERWFRVLEIVQERPHHVDDEVGLRRSDELIGRRRVESVLVEPLLPRDTGLLQHVVE